jgi:regulatory protein
LRGEAGCSSYEDHQHKAAGQAGGSVTREQLEEFKKLSADDKLYNQALRYVAMRPRTRWEIQFYLERKKASPPLINVILNKLSKIELIDDRKYAEAFVHDRQLLRPTSRRKIIAELRKRRVADEVIQQVTSVDEVSDQAALLAVIERKRRQSKYRDDTKLMQYLARQGFGYDDIKTALQQDS